MKVGTYKLKTSFALFLLIFGLLLGCLPFVFAKPYSVLAADPVAEVKATADGSDSTKYTAFSEALKAWGDGKTLVLLSDCTANETIFIPQEEKRTLSLNGHTLALKAGQKGSVLSVNGTLLVLGEGESEGKIKGGNAELGGGIYVRSGNATLRGNIFVTENTAGEGGGVYSSGVLTLEGGVRVEGNQNTDGEDDNIFLSNLNFIKTNDFTGRAGVGVLSGEERFAEGSGSGEFFSDDKDYSVKRENESWFLIQAPLLSISAEYQGDETVYPTSSLDILKEGLNIVGTNVNGVPFKGEIGEYRLSTPSGKLFVGVNEITVTLEESGISGVFSVNVIKPSLVSLSAEFLRGDPVYADMPLISLMSRVAVTGEYDDGIKRTILQSSDATVRENGEEYIDDYFVLSGDLTQREGNFATLSVISAGLSVNIQVEVSRRYVDVTMFTPRELSIMEGDRVQAGAYAFLPDWKDVLGDEIVPEGKIDGKPFDFAALSFGVYSVEISFSLKNERDYELSGGTVKTRLLVYAERFEGKTGDLAFSVTCDGGISPEWDFSLTDQTQSDKTELHDGLQAERVFTLTFFPGQSGAAEQDFTVRIYLADSLLDAEPALLRVKEDGTTQRMEYSVKGEAVAEGDGTVLRRFLEFEAGDLLEARFIVASDSHANLYVILSICFGVLCVVGAGVLVFYFIRKKKLRFKK